MVRSAALVMAVTGAASCGWFGPKSAGPITADYDTQTGRLKALTRDSNGDGTVDEWTYWNGTTAIRGEFDKDFDGTPDRWEYYRDGKVTDLVRVGLSSKNDGIEDTWVFKAPDGGVERIEISTKRNGKVSRWEYYSGSALAKAEEDTKGSGRPDKWEYFTNGALFRLEFDLDGDGLVDRRLDYGPKGVVATQPK